MMKRRIRILSRLNSTAYADAEKNTRTGFEIHPSPVRISELRRTKSGFEIAVGTTESLRCRFTTLFLRQLYAGDEERRF
jgi:hypothetical protein